ncbi:MAG: cytochrome c biogenesis protein CcsA [Lentimicrobiaceae bacterium]|nr:cytochrome c biogenesis protein CcsA [Lentimicrobiaceae bacterium]
MKKKITISYKIIGLLLIAYTVVFGLTIATPDLPIIKESIRNLFFHVVMWMCMFFFFLISAANGILYLAKHDIEHDIKSAEAVNIGLLYGVIGIVTGMVWANFTWGKPWINDPKLNGALISLCTYLAYKILRKSIASNELKARVSAVYNIFAFVILILFIYVIPMISTTTIHPGQSGDATTIFTINKSMRMVFYPSIIGNIIIGYWLWTQRVRIKNIENKLKNLELI